MGGPRCQVPRLGTGRSVPAPSWTGRALTRHRVPCPRPQAGTPHSPAHRGEATHTHRAGGSGSCGLEASSCPPFRGGTGLGAAVLWEPGGRGHTWAGLAGGAGSAAQAARLGPSCARVSGRCRGLGSGTGARASAGRRPSGHALGPLHPSAACFPVTGDEAECQVQTPHAGLAGGVHDGGGFPAPGTGSVAADKRGPLRPLESPPQLIWPLQLAAAVPHTTAPPSRRERCWPGRGPSGG